MNDPLTILCPHCRVANRVPRNRVADGPRCGKCRRGLFTGRPLNLGEADFAAHVGRGDIPLVVDFWAPWCAPCRMMGPAFERAAALLEPRARLAKVNSDENKSLASRYSIRSIPTMVIFKGGKEAARRSGAMDAQEIVAWIESHLGRTPSS